MGTQGGSKRNGTHSVATWKIVNKQLYHNARKLMSAHKLPVDIPQAKELLAFKEELDREVAAARQETNSSLRQIKAAVATVRERLGHVEEGESFVVQLQELMTQVQQQLNDFKSSQRQAFQQLQQEEDVLERDLEMFERRMESDAWHDSIAAAPTKPSGPAPSCSAGKRGGQGLLPEVIEFDAYEEEYGTEGNWHSDDHKEFLRVLHCHKGDYAATVLECSQRMVGFDRLDILAHARWHSQYEELGIRKKLAIQEWRRRREEEARAQRERAEHAVDAGPATRGGAQMSKQEETERRYTKSVIAEWKACKEQEAAAARQAQEAAKRAKAAQEAAQRSARQHEIAAQREARRAKEAAAAERLARDAQAVHVGFHGGERGATPGGRAADTPARRPLTADKNRVLQERNRQMLERRAAAVQSRKEQQSMRAARQAQMAAKVHVTAIPDRTRLFQATASSASRMAAEKENEHGAKDSGFIRHVPHKAPARIPL